MTVTTDAKPATMKQVADVLRIEGESLTNFSKEWGRLDENEKADIKAGIGNGTMTY